ncbi:MAG: DUF6906 family protein [Clostridium paraputrificum]
MRIRHIAILSEYGFDFRNYSIIDETKDNLKVKHKKTGKIYDLRY